jgi:hypothetical protein
MSNERSKYIFMPCQKYIYLHADEDRSLMHFWPFITQNIPSNSKDGYTMGKLLKAGTSYYKLEEVVAEQWRSGGGADRAPQEGATGVLDGADGWSEDRRENLEFEARERSKCKMKVVMQWLLEAE